MKPTSSLRFFLALAGSSLISVFCAHADTLYWDSNGATAGFGSANGTWGTSTFWSADSTGESATANTATTTADILNFGTGTLGYTGGRTVTLSGTQNANSLIFGSASDAVTISGGTALNLGGTTPTITVNNTTSTISSKISGSAFTKNGNGTLIITNTANDFSGNLILDGGILQIGTAHSNSWDKGTLPTTSNLDIQDGIIDTGYYGTRSLGAAAGEVQITGGRSGFSNSIQPDATGKAIWTVNNSTAYTVVWGAANEAGNANSTGYFNPDTFVLNDTGARTVMRWQNPIDLNATTRTIEVSGTGAGAGRGTYATMEGEISSSSGTAGLIKTGAGTLMLNGSNSYNGGTAINEGGVWFVTKAAMPATGNVTVNDGTVLSVGVGNGGGWTTGTSGVGTMGGLLAGDGGQTAAQIIYNGNVALGFNISGTQSYSGIIGDVGSSLAIHIGNKDSGSSGDPFNFSGTLTLESTNTYTGGTFVNRGTLVLGHATDTLLDTGAVSVDGGTLNIGNNTDTVGAVTISSGSITGGSGVLTGSSYTATGGTISGTLGGTAALVKNGSGTLILSGDQQYSGGFTLNDGDVQVSSGTYNGFGTGDLTINGGRVRTASSGTFTTGNDSIWNASFGVFRGITGTATWNHDGGVSLGGDVTVNSPNNFFELHIGGDIDENGGSRSLSFTGSGLTVTLGGDNSHSGGTTYSTSGTLNINSATALGTGALTITSGKLDNTSGGAVSITNVNAQNWNANITFTGSNDLNMGTGAVTMNNNRTVNVIANTLAVGGIGQSGGNRSLTKTGDGTLVMNGDNTYKGTTTVSAGTLIINGNSSTATGNVTVATGATLGGSGTVGGATTVNGALNPGNSPGLLSFESSLTLAASATTTMEVDGLGLGANYDSVSVATALTYGGALILDFGTAFGPGDHSFNLFDFDSETGSFTSVDLAGEYSGSLIDNSGVWGLTDGDNTWTFTESTGVLNLAVAIPEPSTAFLGAIGMLVLMRRRR